MDGRRLLQQGDGLLNETIATRLSLPSHIKKSLNVKRTKLSPSAASGPNALRGARAHVACVPVYLLDTSWTLSSMRICNWSRLFALEGH